MRDLQDRVAVVTGSGSGMGEGIARLFAVEGAAVVISGRDKEKGELVAQSVVGDGGRAVFVRADVSLEADCRGLIDQTVEHFGQIDVLVNNVGLSSRGTIEDTTVELWDKLFATNVRSAFICM
ncbi:MAG: SDR family NAD(P)-dependent oxidoreductase, partial [Acidobacteriota bacterium]